MKQFQQAEMFHATKAELYSLRTETILSENIIRSIKFDAFIVSFRRGRASTFSFWYTIKEMRKCKFAYNSEDIYF